MSTKTTITVEVEKPTGDADPVLCVRATLGDDPEPMLVATKDRRLDDPDTCEAVATLLRSALRLVDDDPPVEFRQELTAIQQMLTVADTQEKRLELSDRLIRLGRTVEPEQHQLEGPGDMVCKAHDVAGCLKCWDPDQEEPN